MCFAQHRVTSEHCFYSLRSALAKHTNPNMHRHTGTHTLRLSRTQTRTYTRFLSHPPSGTHTDTLISSKFSVSVFFCSVCCFVLLTRGVRGVARDVGCAHPGFAPYLACIRCPKVRCVHPLKSLLGLSGCVSVFQKTLAFIRFRNDPCVHYKSQKNNIRIRHPKLWFLLPGGYKSHTGFHYPILVYQGVYNRPEAFRRSLACNLIPDCVLFHYHPLLYGPDSKTQSFGCLDPNVGFEWHEDGWTQGVFLKRMHARVILGTDARNQKGHRDGCTQRTVEQRIRGMGQIPDARNLHPGCTQPL